MPFQYLYRGDDFRDLSRETRDLLDQRDRSLENHLNEETGRFTAYTPTWTATTTNPTIGNGTIAGSYTQLGKLVIVEARLLAGSTTTYGAGNYIMSLPVEAVATVSPARQMGNAFITDDGNGGQPRVMAVEQYSTTAVTFVPHEDSTGLDRWTPTHPFTFAQSDEFRMLLTYEAA